MTDNHPLYQDAVDGAIYTVLFGLTRAEVNEALGLPSTASEDDRRDKMGLLALEALSRTERALAEYLRTLQAYGVSMPPSIDDFAAWMRAIAEVVARTFATRGKALLTATYDQGVM